VAHVERWNSAILEQAVDDAGLEPAVRDIAAATGVDVTQPFAFVIESELTALDMHVINGECPAASGSEVGGPHAPWRLHLGVPVRATLVGFYAQGHEGEMTHHGSNAHIHALLKHNGGTITGQVETVTVAAGATVRVPAAR